MDTDRTFAAATATLPLEVGGRARWIEPVARPTRRAVPGNDFLEHLRRETRRSMRSGASLSLALYQVTDGQDGEQLLEILHESKRETDYLGHVDADLVTVLCTDTDAAGVQVFASKIAARSPQPDAILATFPDPLFERLLDGRGSRAPALDASGAADALVTYRGKRLLDVGLAGLALLLLLVPMLLIALLVRLESRGPAIFRQTRLGHGGQPFTFFKFRSMTVDADDTSHRAFTQRFVSGAGEAPAADDAMAFKMRGDPRITRLGGFLRRSSLDELPQLYNVLRGDMSLVGPRPALPYETEHYQPWHLRRIRTVRPGITGLWQVQGRSRVTFNEMVRMDLRYIHNCSLWLDLRILFRTVAVVLRAEGAG